jgi:cerevisin
MLAAAFSTLALVASVLAAPAPLLPVVRTLNGRSVPNSYIVKIKATSDIPVENRGNWLNNVLSRGDATVQDADTLKLGWPKNIFDGLSGTFDKNAVNALRASPDVDYIVEGTYLCFLCCTHCSTFSRE